jgi:hypothetical protein
VKKFWLLATISLMIDPTRNIEYGYGIGYCDTIGDSHTSPDWKGPGTQFISAIGWREKKISAIIMKQQFGFPIRTT